LNPSRRLRLARAKPAPSKMFTFKLSGGSHLSKADQSRTHPRIQNPFLRTVFKIALEKGADPKGTVNAFKRFNSTDFIGGPPATVHSGRIPQNVWSAVCAQYSASAQAPYHLLPVGTVMNTVKKNPMVFMRSKTTSALIRSGVIAECFYSAKRLYQYLNWTVSISKVAQTMAVLEGRRGLKLLVINVELHDSAGSELFALCSPNDSGHGEPWDLVSLFTAQKLTRMLQVDVQRLPRGVRAVSSEFEQCRAIKADPKGLKTRILEHDAVRRMGRYFRLKCIRTGTRKKSEKRAKSGQSGASKQRERVLRVELSAFYEAVQMALRDDAVQMIPIVSFRSVTNREGQKVEDFSVDHLLPVQVDDGWIGVVYRGTECKMTLMDRYDITNKAILCDPRFDERRLDSFQNPWDRLRIVMENTIDSAKRGRNAKSNTMNTINTINTVNTVNTIEASTPSMDEVSLHSVSSVTPRTTPRTTPQTTPRNTPIMGPTSTQMTMSTPTPAAPDQIVSNENHTGFHGSAGWMVSGGGSAMTTCTRWPPPPQSQLTLWLGYRVAVTDRELLEFMDQLIRNVEHNAAYFGQYI